MLSICTVNKTVIANVKEAGERTVFSLMRSARSVDLLFSRLKAFILSWSSQDTSTSVSCSLLSYLAQTVDHVSGAQFN